MGVLSDLIAAEVGRPTVPVFDPLVTSVGTSVVRVLDPGPDRVSFIIVNLSAVAIYVAPRLGVSATSGIRLAPNGGSLSLSWRDDFHLVGWEWYAVADAAASAILTLAGVAR